MTELERKIGYAFHDAELLTRALTTPACRMDHPEGGDNQRLEFLGDAVFGLLSADAVFAAFPDDAVEIVRADVSVPLIQLRGYDPYEVLSRKLGWNGSAIK